jgi:short-subunit dehydrogenase involved in D-alanine esterification of teichoic acids
MRLRDDVVVYGGTSGLGRLLAEHLAVTHPNVFIVGRTKFKSALSNIHFITIDFDAIDSLKINREFLAQHDTIGSLFFNIGGSFGLHEDVASVDNIVKLSQKNLFYIVDTIDFLLKHSSITNKNFIFISTNSLLTFNGNPGYIMLKGALEIFVQHLYKNHRNLGLNLFIARLPLILYPSRFLAKQFLNLKSSEEQQCFIDDRLEGYSPLTPESAVQKLISRFSILCSNQPIKNTRLLIEDF